ncbi:MAG TPA: hypothetical protein VGF08_11820 [Terriglobales bacterium]|jgi:hypothetical protein
MPFLPPGISREQPLEQPWVNTEIGLTQVSNHLSQFNQTVFGGTIQDTNGASYRQPQVTSGLDPVPFVHEHKIRLYVERQQNSVMFTAVKIG